MNRPLTPEQVADRWGCSANTVRAMIKASRLRAFRLGRIYRVPVEAVEDFECQTIASDGSTNLEALRNQWAEEEGIALGLEAISGQIRRWLDWHAERRSREPNLITDGDTHLITLPVPFWPSHGQLENWIATMNEAAKLVRRHPPHRMSREREGCARRGSTGGLCDSTRKTRMGLARR